MSVTSTDLPQIANYQSIALLHESDRTFVYRAQCKDNEQSVIIKLMRSEYPSFSEFVQFRNQYAIAKNLNIEGIVKPYALERYENRYSLIMEDMGGVSLAKQKELFSLPQFFDIALQLTAALHLLHENRIIHKDIKPANILIHPQTGQVKLIDFSISTSLPKETQTLQTPNVLEGTLAYLSPEQTGRMNRDIDYRSDYYSLGVTFYELLTGKLPFETTDPLELIHCHIAKTPPVLGSRDSLGFEPKGGVGSREEIPQMLSEIILKLMAKNAEDRYQSALGLKYDLEQCLHQLKTTGEILPFKIGQQDLSDRFVIPEKLYGRETEVAQLLAAFNRVANPTKSPQTEDRGSEMFVVAGFSGIGKTAVINEVHKPIVKQRGYFIQGKFDQFQKNIPFSAFVQAFRDLMGRLLSESDAQLERWKTKILDALGENGQIIVEVIPELEQIIGTQPKSEELSGSAAQNRFNFLFQKFIQVFATSKHPLVIFVDDLQWADAASLQLIELLTTSGKTGYLLLLGAYRDNEVFPAHPLMLTLDAIGKSGANINSITLTPLSQRDVNCLVADTLNCKLELAQPLTELVHKKTQGNPFFVTQFLQGLYDDKWIVLNSDLGFWECDLTRVQELALTDDVVEFMAKRLHKLPRETQEILKLAACIGNQFDLATLAMAGDRSEEEVATALWRSLQEGLVLPLTDTYKFFQDIPQSPTDRETKKRDRISVVYKFLHDRVQQAAYSLIPEDSKEATHLKIGELLLNKIALDEQQQHIFAIVNQLNMAIELIKEVSAKEKLARLNLIAGKKARASAAYQPAYNYLQIGLQVLREDSWQEQYELSLSLYTNATEIAYLNGDFDKMYELATILTKNAKSLLDKIKVYEILIQANIAQNLLQEAIKTGLNVVSELGVNVPASPTHEELESVLAEVGDRLGETTLENLANLPPMTDTKQLAILRILSSIYAPSFMTVPLLCLLTVAKQVAISMEYGNNPQSAFAYGNYGVILCGILMDIDLGYQFGELALELLEKLNVSSFKAKVMMTVNVCVKPWKEAIRQTLPAFLEAYTSALEVGDIEFAGYSAVTYCYHSYAAGKELEVVAKEMETYGGQAAQLKQQLALNNLSPFHQAVLNLQGESSPDKPWVLLGEIFNEPTTLPSLQEANDHLSLFYFYVNKISLCYLFEAYSEAVEEAQLGDRYLNAATASPMVAIFYFYDSLSRLVIYSQASNPEKKALLSRVAANQEKMLLWAEKAPMNFQHKYDLVEAEIRRISGDRIKAIDLYDLAIAGAKENEYLQEEALANELAAKFYLEWGKEKFAALYLQQAYYSYAQWGAKAKTDRLEKSYPQLLSPILKSRQTSLSVGATITSLSRGTISSTTTGTGEMFDLVSLMKASRTLTEEIDLDRAIANLMQVMMENAGAETGALMLFHGKTLMLEAKIVSDICESQPIPIEESQAVPLSIVNIVKRTRKPLVLDHAAQNPTHVGDPYVRERQPQSVLCVPLLDRAQLRGILYLENNQCSGAFTSDRVEILNLLCTQAAISLENARLYRQAQQALSDLQQAQLQLVQNEKMATLGNLVAGVAHEINNPLGFIGGNVKILNNTLADLFAIIEGYQKELPNPSPQLTEEIEDLDLDFLLEDLPKTIISMQEGVNRIANISTSLRTFSRTDTDKKTEFNLHDGLDSTLLILKYRLKANEERPGIQIVKNYGDIPAVKCYAGQINQVFMNLLANAIDALEESNVGKTFQEIEKAANRITIRTEFNAEKKSTIVAIIDNGTGMPEEVKTRLFEQGFTTKGVGKGTGLGMAIALQIVEEKHGGTISCYSELGKGTEFIMSLPVI